MLVVASRLLLTAAVALLIGPAEASAQKDAFLDAFVEFHSVLAGSFGDEGARAAPALATMQVSLDGWRQTQREGEAALEARPGVTPAEIALFYAGHGRFVEAAGTMEQAITAEPGRAPLYVVQGFLLEAAGQRDDANAAFAAAARIAPSDALAAYLAASRRPDSTTRQDLGPFVESLMAAAGRGTAALEQRPFLEFRLIRDASARTPVFSPALYAEGFAHFAASRFSDTVEHFRRAATRDPFLVDPAPRHPRAVQGVAELRNRRGDPAIEHLQAVVAALPKSSEAHRLLAIAYRAVGRLPDSIRHLTEAVALAPTDERTRVALGSTLAEAGLLPDAERVLRETIDQTPASGDARWVLAGVYERLGDGLEAIAVLEEAAGLTVIAGKAALYWRIAELAHRHQDFERVALALYHRAKLLPNEPHAHKDLGLAYSRLGRSDEALIELLMTTMLGVEDAETLTTIGQIHLAEERLTPAESALRKAVAIEPENPQSQYALGMTLVRSGRAEEARQHLEAFQRLRDAALEEQRRQFQEDISDGVP
jgi:tetratricopeptide (TPR) repeat protein